MPIPQEGTNDMSMPPLGDEYRSEVSYIPAAVKASTTDEPKIGRYLNTSST